MEALGSFRDPSPTVAEQPSEEVESLAQLLGLPAESAVHRLLSMKQTGLQLRSCWKMHRQPRKMFINMERQEICMI